MSDSRRIIAIVRETLTGFHVVVWVRWLDAQHVLTSVDFDSLTGSERFLRQCAIEIGVPTNQIDIFHRRADGGPLPFASARVSQPHIADTVGPDPRSLRASAS
jgi:hypothetical protein